eukprot:scaffold51546_cov59-Attheya_sp.AAC.4
MTGRRQGVQKQQNRSLKISESKHPHSKSKLAIRLTIIFLLIWALIASVYYYSINGSIKKDASTTLNDENKGEPLLRRREPALQDATQTKWTVDNKEEQEWEGPFFETLKSCVSSNASHKKKCLQHAPEGVQRVGILSPPGGIADEFASWLQGHEVAANIPNMELIPTSHVPPYGYGKSHGWTKLIRLVIDPLSYSMLDTYYYYNQDSKSEITVEVNDSITQVYRQIVRWHCRLSHVAAHTALLTIHLSDMLKDPQSTMDQVREFLLSTEDGAGITAMDGASNVEVPASSVDPMRDTLQNLLTRASKDFVVPSNKGEELTMSFGSSIMAALASEMKESKNLSAWPCRSFWKMDPQLQMGAIPKQAAQAMSPDCSSTFSQCFVKTDKCEEKGDPVCQ